MVNLSYHKDFSLSIIKKENYMTIKELVTVIRCNKISVNFDGFTNELHPEDQLQMDAYGDFIVETANIVAVADEAYCEISVKTSFARKGA